MMLANLENADITHFQTIKIHVQAQSKVVSIHVASEKNIASSALFISKTDITISLPKCFLLL